LSRSLRALVVAGTLPVLACGIPEQKYKAAVAETEKAVKDGEGQKQRADACEQRLKDESARAGAAEKRAGELSERLAALEKAASSASADAAQQRELAAQLAKTRETLETEKAAAAAEADRQRQLAVRLEQEKTAASLDADQQRKLAAKLEEESSAAKVEAERQRLLALELQQQKSVLEKRSAEYEALASSLDKEIKDGQIQVSELKGKLTVRMAEKVLFPSGSATVSAAGKKTLGAIGDAMKGVKGRIIRVEGHTDNVPIKSAKFPSNWELSSARAIAVVRILQDRGVDPTLLGAAGYAEFQPIAPNDTAPGRAQNRRIEISLAAPLGERPTAPPAAAPAARP
jgi:chemotaxis protein MotB